MPGSILPPLERKATITELSVLPFPDQPYILTTPHALEPRYKYRAYAEQKAQAPGTGSYYTNRTRGLQGL